MFQLLTFFQNRVRQKPKEVGPTRSSARLKPSIIFSYFFRALSRFFHSNSGVCYTFHLHFSSVLVQRKKIQVPFVCVHR